MSLLTPAKHDDTDVTRRRRPLEYQRNIGADMSMMFFVHVSSLSMFTHPDHYLIKGFGAEAVATVFFPQPSWITGLEYQSLTSDCEDGSSNNGFFGLNMSFYKREIIASEWENMWFFMSGRVHPYTLIWEVKTGEALATADDLEEHEYYSTATIMVRDQGYQPSV